MLDDAVMSNSKPENISRELPGVEHELDEKDSVKMLLKSFNLYRDGWNITQMARASTMVNGKMECVMGLGYINMLREQSTKVNGKMEIVPEKGRCIGATAMKFTQVAG